MPNTYFRFKQFTIQQDRCSMKVCTDSCILGAWTALRLGRSKKILDIGTGTGLLPLMLAQKSAALLDTIEMDPESAAQATENINQSPWAERIHLIKGDVRNFAFEGKYDFIITNPPFYESDLRSPVDKKNRAKHDESLTMETLVTVIRNCLHADGAFSILLPFQRTDYFEKLATDKGFFLYEKLNIRQTPVHAPFRTICVWGYKKAEPLPADELIIKDDSGRNSLKFTELVRDYYL